MKKITIEDVYKQKKIRKEVELFYDSEILGGRIDFERIQPDKVLDILQDTGKGLMSAHDANLYLIYLSVPMFRNADLLAEYEIKDSPYKVIDEIFNHNVMETTTFADKILTLYGFQAEKVKSIKKR